MAGWEILLIAVRLLALGLLVGIAIVIQANAHDKATVDNQNPYIAAFEAAEAEKWTKARRLAAAGDDPLITKVVTWLELSRSRRLPTFDSLSAFIEENPDWPNRKRLHAMRLRR